jgi:hypothetical protein
MNFAGPTTSASLFLSDPFEGRLVGFDIHELSRLGVTFDPVASRGLGLRALLYSANAVAVTDRRVLCHDSSFRIKWLDLTGINFKLPMPDLDEPRQAEYV